MAKHVISDGKADSFTTLLNDSMFILKGGSANETTIREESYLNVSSGASTGNTYISSGGTMNIFKGGSAFTIYVSSGGTMNVLKGGSAFYAHLSKGADLFVSKGGYLSRVDLHGSASAIVCKGGYASKVNVSAGIAVFSGTVSSASVIDNSLIEVRGGVVSSASVLMFGSLTLNKGTVGSAEVEANGSLTVYKGTVGSAIVSGGLEVYKGGTANNVTVDQKGSMTIYGGKANSVTLQGEAQIDLYGGSINDLTLIFGTVCVSSGGTMKGVTVDNAGTLIIDDATVSNLTVLKGDVAVCGGKVIGATMSDASMHVSSGGTVNKITLEDGYLNLDDSGTKASGVLIKCGGELDIDDYAVASNITIESGGSITFYESGTINGLKINSGAQIDMGSGGTATKVNWTPGDGFFNIGSTAIVTFTGKYSGVYCGLNGEHISRMKVFDAALGAGESAYVAKGGSANAVEMLDGGMMVVWSGGTAAETSINYDCCMMVSGGTVNDTRVNDGGELYLCGGKAGNTTIDGGTMEIYGGSASGVTIKEGGELIISSGTATDVDWTPFVGDLHVGAEGYVSFTNELTGIYYTGPDAYTEEALTGWEVKKSTDSMYVMSGACAENTRINRGSMFVFGGSAVGTVISPSDWGFIPQMYLYDNASASNTVVSYGDVHVCCGAMAEQTKLNQGGFLHIYSGGSAVDTTIVQGGVFVSGGFADDVKVSSGGSMLVEKGGTASSVTAIGGVYRSGAEIFVSSGAVVSGLTLEYGARLYVEKGGKVVNVSSSYGSLIVAKKGATVKVTKTIAAESEDSDHDVENGNGWENKKKKTVYDSILDSTATQIGSNTNDVRFDDEYKDMAYEGYRNYVGYGDEIDFIKITPEVPAELTFLIEATDAAKFTIWHWDDKKGKMVSLQSTTLQDVTGDPVYGKQYYAETKGILLADTGEYYLSVESTNASKGGNAYYNVYLNGESTFYNRGDHSDDWTDLEDYGSVSTEYGDVGQITGPEELLVDENWVGFDDEFDYMTFSVKDDANVSFSITADDAVKFTVFTLVENEDGGWEKMTLLSKTVKPKGGAEKTETTAVCQFTGDLEKTYFFSVQSLNAKKAGSGANYSVSVATYEIADSEGAALEGPLAFLDSRDACSLDMPETSGSSSPDAFADTGLDLTDALSFGRNGADVLADVSAASLAELDDKSARLDVDLLA